MRNKSNLLSLVLAILMVLAGLFLPRLAFLLRQQGQDEQYTMVENNIPNEKKNSLLLAGRLKSLLKLAETAQENSEWQTEDGLSPTMACERLVYSMQSLAEASGFPLLKAEELQSPKLYRQEGVAAYCFDFAEGEQIWMDAKTGIPFRLCLMKRAYDIDPMEMIQFYYLLHYPSLLGWVGEQYDADGSINAPYEKEQIDIPNALFTITQTKDAQNRLIFELAYQ